MSIQFLKPFVDGTLTVMSASLFQLLIAQLKLNLCVVVVLTSL